MREAILYDSAMRLFGDLVTSETLAAAENGTWPAALWRAVEEAGYLDVLADGTAGMVEAVTILCAAGYHAAPVPLLETMLARLLCAACGLRAPLGPLSLAGDAGSGDAIPWGRAAAAIAVMSDDGVRLVEPGSVQLEAGRNLAGEPRDRLAAPLLKGQTAPLPNAIEVTLLRRLGALGRAAQMAGAMEAALALSVRYANDRTQFGRPIGKFQAIQQQLARLAEEAAAASVAVDGAAAAVAQARSSAGLAVAAAKIRAGEAAGKVAEIAHQVHGAIGFTHEHSLHYLTRRLWSWRDEFGSESEWALELGRDLLAAGADQLWPAITTA
jgi:acyl-CoA dehydrogenase